mmetsp:Transcript_4322/g.12385  ORF Transcript_4322/g.12385 Transcript_4322/m.12385 type:complete len:255 (+) Transcript_4322:2550-3314(+)
MDRPRSPPQGDVSWHPSAHPSQPRREEGPVLLCLSVHEPTASIAVPCTLTTCEVRRKARPTPVFFCYGSTCRQEWNGISSALHSMTSSAGCPSHYNLMMIRDETECRRRPFVVHGHATKLLSYPLSRNFRLLSRRHLMRRCARCFRLASVLLQIALEMLTMPLRSTLPLLLAQDVVRTSRLLLAIRRLQYFCFHRHRHCRLGCLPLKEACRDAAQLRYSLFAQMRCRLRPHPKHRYLPLWQLALRFLPVPRLQH